LLSVAAMTTTRTSPAFLPEWTFSLIAVSALGCGDIKSGVIVPGDGGDASSEEGAAGNAPMGGDGSSDATTDAVEASAEAAIMDAPPEAPVDASDASDGSSTTSDAGDASDAPPEGSVSPLTVSPSHLKLWLNAAVGVQCASGRVNTWTDQSGNGNDATLLLRQLGPQCQVAGGAHAANGVDLPYFSAPSSATPNVVDETLDVNLDYLQNSSYTIFAVERRWADYALGSSNNEDIIGATWPSSIESANPSCSSGVPDNQDVFLGYIFYNGVPQIVLDQSCNNIIGNVDPVGSVPPAFLSVDTAKFDITQGHEIRMNGVLLVSDRDLNPPQSAQGGAIGRGLVKTTSTGLDPRFRGDIAEIVVYDAALSVSDRRAVEGYLRAHWQI
jgi:hypothetical protein